MGEEGRALSLKATFSFIVLALGLMTLGTATFLVALAFQLRGSMGVVADAVESVHAAEDLEVDLLLHARVADPLDRAKIEADIARKVSDTEQFVSTETSRDAMMRTKRAIQTYLRARSDTPRVHEELDDAVAALEQLVDVNLAEARAEDAKMDDWERIASRVGIIVALALVGVVGAALLWLQRSAFRKVLEIADSMQRFGAGERSVRSREGGPLELRAMAQQFNRMAHELERQHAAELVSLASIAHDLRNPLSALKLALAVAATQEHPSPELVHRTLGTVHRQVDKLDRMVGDLLDAARIESGELDLHIEPCDVRPILEDVCDLYRAISPSHHIALETPGDKVSVPCDRLRIEQVLGNLVSNAVKYSPAGGRIELALSIADQAALISVSDRGVGIDADKQALLFAPFQRASSDAIPGVGLGLFVAKRIVEAHRGQIEVVSAPGEGSTFRVRLPMNPS